MAQDSLCWQGWGGTVCGRQTKCWNRGGTAFCFPDVHTLATSSFHNNTGSVREVGTPLRIFPSDQRRTFFNYTPLSLDPYTTHGEPLRAALSRRCLDNSSRRESTFEGSMGLGSVPHWQGLRCSFRDALVVSPKGYYRALPKRVGWPLLLRF